MLKNVITFFLFILIFSVESLWADATLYLKYEGKSKKIRYSQWQTKYAKDDVELTVKNHPNYKREINYLGVNFVKFMQI